MKRLFLLCLALLILPFTVSAQLDDAEAYYSHDNADTTGSTSEDVSGNNNDATINGATTGVLGIINEAYSFDGVDDYVESNNNIGISGGSSRSISFWVKTDGLGNDVQRPVMLGTFTGNDGEGFGVRFDYRETFDRIFLDIKNGRVRWNYDISDDQWHHIVITSPDSNLDNVNLYVDGVQQTLDGSSSVTSTSINTANNNLYIGNREGSGEEYKGDIDELAVYTRALNSSEVTDLYNNGTGFNPYSDTKFTLTAVNAFDNAQIQNFSAVLTVCNATSCPPSSYENFTYNTTNGEIVTPFGQEETDGSFSFYAEIENITFSAENYQNRTYTGLGLDTETNTSFEGVLSQAQSKFTEALTKVTNTSLTDFNVTINGNTFSSNTAFSSPTSYNATFSKTGWYNKTQKYETATLNQSFTGVYDQRLNITADELLNGSTVQNFSGTVTGPNGYTETFNTSNGTALVNVESQEEYEVYIDSAPGYATIFNNGSLIMNKSFTTNSNATYNVDFQTYTYNTVAFSVFDADTNSLVTEQVNLSIINGPEDRDVTSSNGSLIVQDLLTGSYTARFETNTYATQDVFFTVKNSSYQEIDLYLDDTTTTIFFTVRDTIRDPVDDAVVTMKTTINGSEVLIGQKSTDFSGTASYQLNPAKTYTFTVVASGFSTFEGTLTPTLTEYTVTLSEVGDGEYVNANEDFDYRTNVTVTNGTWVWNWKTTSATNAINQQNYSFVYDGTTYQGSSTSSSGTSFTETGVVVQGQPFLNVSYEVDTVNGFETFTNVFSLLDQFPIFQGFKNIEGESGVVVQGFIATIVTTVFVVTLTLGRNIVAGVYTGAVSLGFFGFLGFLPLSVTLISIASLVTIGLSLGRVRI